MNDEPKTLRWWRLLSTIAALNVVLWLVTSAVADVGDRYVQRQLALSAVYVLVCAFRSVLPRIDLERYCLWDTPLSSVFPGRSAATVAEVSFAGQCGLLLHEIGGAAGLPVLQHLAWPVVGLLALAQVFCWSSVLTLSHLGHAIEESLWAVTFAMIGVCVGFAAFHVDGTLQAICAVGALCSAGYVGFMVTVDVPMYVRRWRAGRDAGIERLSLGAGVADALKRRVVTRDWAVWKPEVAWLTGYFSFAVWLSLAMVLLPRS